MKTNTSITSAILFGTGMGMLLASGCCDTPANVGFPALGIAGLALWLQLRRVLERLASGTADQGADSHPQSRLFASGNLATTDRIDATPAPETKPGAGDGSGSASMRMHSSQQQSLPFPAIDAASKSCVPRVVMSRKLLASIHDYICSFTEKRGPDLEIGGMLIGTFEPATDNEPPIVRLQGFIDAGPKAECQPGSILMDAEYQGRMLQAIQLKHPRAASQGMFHLHHGHFDECSLGDRDADIPAVKAADTGTLVFVIVTRNNPRNTPLSLRMGQLKFDLFVMARHLGPRYQKVQPVLTEETTLLEPEALLARWVEIRGQQARADWALLRRIHGLRPFYLREIADGEQRDLWLTAPTVHHELAIHVHLRQDGALRLFLGNEQTPAQECKGPWTQPNVAPFIFVSQLVLLALEHLRGDEATPSMGRHFASLLEDRQRLVAEVRAMRERFGDEPQLCRKGGQVFWTCIARQNGREFPIEIHYPAVYPYEPPTIRCIANLKAGCPHVLHGQTLCWIDFYGSHSEWNPGRDTAATALVAIHRWFACYLVWLTAGQWPKSADK